MQKEKKISLKKEWEKPNIEKLNIKKTASGTSDNREDHPVHASSI